MRIRTVLCIAMLLPVSAWAANVLNVCKSGCAYSSIQGAVDSASSGDTLSIGKGTYFENVRIIDKTLTLKGAGKDFTTVDGGFHGSVFYLEATNLRNPLPRVAFLAMTITHGSADSGGGINDLFARLYVQDVTVTSNRAVNGGGGVALSGGDLTSNDFVRALITHNIVTGRTTSEGVVAGWGGGILEGIETTLTLADSSITRNSATNSGGGLYVDYHSTGSVVNSTVTDNAAGIDGGGVAGGPIGGYQKGESAHISISGSTIANNSAKHDGGGLVMTAGGATIASSVFAHNSAGHNGGGIADVPGFSGFNLSDSFVVQNKAGAAGGGISSESLTLTNTTVAGNTPSNCDPASGGCM
jgi:hypothetical protein